ncbi:MAG: type II toxin-antitoxin system CcdA family antitoxin [Rhizobiaceae bacterium]
MRIMSTRKPANLSLDAELISDARDLDINVSRAAEHGIRLAVASEKARRWKAENAKAIADANEWVAANGLPLAKHRMF